jgi:hypothetical protein
MPTPSLQKNKSFSWSYFLLIPFLVIGLVPWLKFRIPFRLVLLLPLLWVLFNFKTMKAKLLPRESEFVFYKWLFFFLITVFMRFLYGLIHGEFFFPGTAEGVDSFFIILVFFILHSSVNTGRLKELRTIVLVVLGSLTIFSIMAINGLEVVEGGARAITAASGEYTDIKEVFAALSEGVGGFGNIYGIGLLIVPLIVMLFSVKILMRVFLLFGVALLLMATIKAGFSILMMGIGFSLVALLLYFMKIRGLPFTIIIGILIICIVFVASTPSCLRFILPVLDKISELTLDNNYLFRVKALSDFIQGDDNSYAFLRSQLYWDSIGIFFTAPLTGYYGFSDIHEFSTNIGAHSHIFDVLGSYGLLGFFVEVAMYFYYFKYVKIMMATCGYERYYGIIGIFFSSYVLIAFLNPVGGYPMFTDFLLILPGIVFFAEPRFPRRQVGMEKYPIPLPNLSR